MDSIAVIEHSSGHDSLLINVMIVLAVVLILALPSKKSTTNEYNHPSDGSSF